jgi:hypothetical protein
MADHDRTEVLVQANIFEPRISEEQRRFVVRYDALRAVMAKFGRPFGADSSLIVPAPRLHVLTFEAWRDRQAGGIPTRPAFLEFRAFIPGARHASLWDLSGERELFGPFDFDFPQFIPVIDPGVPATVEVTGHHGRTFKIGIVERVEDGNVPNALED